MTEFRTASQDAAELCPSGIIRNATTRLRSRPVTQRKRTVNAKSDRWFRCAAAKLCLGALLVAGAGASSAASASSDSRERDPAEQAVGTRDAPLAVPAAVADNAAIERLLPPVAIVAAAPSPIGGWQEAAVDPRDGGVAPSRGLVDAAGAASSAAADIDGTVNRDPGELLRFGEMQVPRWIVETILRASDVTGVDPVYMMALADKESSFLPDSKARTSSAEGLFQFLSATWLELVHKFGARHGLADEAASIQLVDGQYVIPEETMREHVLDLRRDPYLSALMAAEMKKRDRELIEKRLGRALSRSEFYLAHFFGVNSASKFMSLLDEKPKQSASRVFPAAAKANKDLFFEKAGRKKRHLSVSEVFDKIDEMIDKRLDRYEGVAVVAYAEASL
jgi:Transglycosylase SLT domain